jgi:ribosome biogenesis GTPase
LDLNTLGWNSHFSHEFDLIAGSKSGNGRALAAGRVCADSRHIYTILTEAGELSAEVSGKFRAEAGVKADFPVVGDWVAAALRSEEGKAVIHAVLPRMNSFSRRSAGYKTEEQVIAANIDTAFIVTAADGDFNPRRVERYLTLAWNSGAEPVVVLNKTDMSGSPEDLVAELSSVAVGVPILPMSAETGVGLDALFTRLEAGETAALLGSSGVGKSTIINRLLGFMKQDTFAVREDDSRGRHTTTRRELIVLPAGGILIDNPGMREVGLWGEESGLEETFFDIEELASRCRFGDCGHGSEPGCAVRAAMEDSRLDPERFQSYVKLQKELRWAAAREVGRLSLEEKRRWKAISKLQKQLKKERGP